MKTLTKFFFLSCLILAACNNAQQGSSESNESDAAENASGMIGEVVEYSTDSTNMSGYIAYDSGIEGKVPGVIVVHEWWGHNDYVRQRADMLAELGYVAFALDMYGEGKTASHPEDAGKFSGMVMSNLPEAKARFESAIAALKSNPKVDTTKIAAIGYCFGGSVALSMANAGYDLDAVAAFHSGVQLPIPPSEDIKARVLVANGADDPFIPAQSVADYRSAMDKVGADYKYISYEGVLHSFTSPFADSLGQKFELPLKYDKDADEDSWRELQQLLDSAFSVE